MSNCEFRENGCSENRTSLTDYLPWNSNWYFINFLNYNSFYKEITNYIQCWRLMTEMNIYAYHMAMSTIPWSRVRGANNRTYHELPHILWNPRAHCYIHRRAQLDPTHPLVSYSINIHFITTIASFIHVGLVPKPVVFKLHILFVIKSANTTMKNFYCISFTFFPSFPHHWNWTYFSQCK